jgi:hypothetical protein
VYLYLLWFVLFVLCLLYCFVYVYVFLLFLSVLPPSDNSIAVNNNDNGDDYDDDNNNNNNNKPTSVSRFPLRRKQGLHPFFVGDFTQRRTLVSYRCFGPPCRLHLQVRLIAKTT